MINLFFEDTGILLRKRSLTEADCPSDEAEPDGITDVFGIKDISFKAYRPDFMNNLFRIFNRVVLALQEDLVSSLRCNDIKGFF